MSIRIAPCEWPADLADCTLAGELEGSGDPEMFVEAAVEYLWHWTGKRFGLCTETVRPCRADCADLGAVSTFFGGPVVVGNAGSAFVPVLVGGSWLNLSCGSCGGDRCGCSSLQSIRLPGPLHSIESITIDGEVLPSGNYRIDDNRFLVRTDGDAWPLCQNLDLPTSESGTWEVTYKRGIDVPIGGQIAAGVLACELAKAACNDSSCQLPKRVQSITRQGVTIAMLDSFDDVDKGHTGIWLIDSWVASVTKAALPPRVYSPDVRPRARKTTWSG